MQTKPFQSSNNIVEAISKKKRHWYGYYFEIETMENLIYFKINQIPMKHIIAIVNIKSLSLN